MTRTRIVLPLLGLALLVGCPQTQPTDTNTADMTLSTTEGSMAALGMTTIGAISATSGASGSGVSAAPGQTSLTSGTTGVGDCPEATFETDGLGALSVTLGFGDGCATDETHPFGCSGSVAGSLSITASTLSASFAQFQCGNFELSGETELAFSQSAGVIGMEGTWSLNFQFDGSGYGTIGEGTVSYDVSDSVLAVTEFSANVTGDEAEFEIQMSGVRTSYATYGNFIPFAGTVILTSDSTRTLTIVFDENSPSTGVVTVRIDNGPAFELSLSEL